MFNKEVHANIFIELIIFFAVKKKITNLAQYENASKPIMHEIMEGKAGGHS